MLNPELKLTTITPDAHGDWLNQRRDDFGKFIGIDGKKNNGLAVFSNFSMGIVTSRDSWCFNASKRTIEANFKGCIGFYNEQVNLAASEGDSFERNDDPSRISWSRSTKRRLLKKIYCPDFDARLLAPALYRPFVLQNVYMEPFWIEAAGQISSLFPFDGAQNLAIGIASIGASSFSCLISNRILDFHVLESGTQCLPRYLYRPVGEAAKATKAKTTGQADLFAGSDAGELDASNGQSGEQVIINGYVREDAIKPEAVRPRSTPIVSSTISTASCTARTIAPLTLTTCKKSCHASLEWLRLRTLRPLRRRGGRWQICTSTTSKWSLMLGVLSVA